MKKGWLFFSVMSSIIIPYRIDSFTASNLHNYMWANYNQFSGNKKTANNWYQKIFSCPSSVYTYKGYIHFLYDLGKYQDIIKLTDSLNNSFEKDPEIQHIFALAFEKTNNHAQSDARFIRLNDQFKDHQEIALHTANVYLRRKEPQNALKVIDNLLNNSPKKPNNFVFYFLKAQICMQLNKQEDARTHIKKSLEMHPHFDKGWLFLAILEEQAGKIDAAIKGYTTFLEVTDSASKAVEQRLLTLVFQQKMLEKNNKQPLLISRSCFEKALLLFKQKKYVHALEQIEQCLKQSPNNNDNKLLKIQILSAQNQFDKAITALKSWIEQEPDNSLWYKTLHILSRMGAPQPLITESFEQLKKQYPDHVWPGIYLADIYLRDHNTNAALTCLQEVAKKIDDALLKTKILFQISLLYYENEEYDQMQQTLAQLNKLSPDFAPQLNLSAYYYASTHDTIKAQSLLDKALKQQPHNPHFLDTQALIFYEKKQYKKAHKLLQELVKQVPDDATILIHLAQVLYMLDNKEKAREIMKKAEKKAKHAHEKKIISRLNQEWNQNKTPNNQKLSVLSPANQEGILSPA